MKRNAALLASAALAGTIGIGGVVAAQASAPTGNGDQSTSSTESETESDGPDQGPDANPDEPGHQDADDAGDATEAEGTESEPESDGPDQGPDANPDEPGHQDADDGTAD